MRSVADFRRAATVGAVFDVTNHVYPELSGRRRVVKAQSKNLCLTFPENHPRFAPNDGSWLSIPKAEECSWNADGSVTITFADCPKPFATIREVGA